MSKQNEPESKHTAVPSLASASGSALTPQQIANWKKAFPELSFLPDDSIQQFRNNLQKIIDRDAAATLAPNVSK